MTHPRPFRFGVMAAKAGSSAEWIDTAKKAEDLGYSALLMHSTQGKCYSTAEYETLTGEAGFGEFRYEPTAVDRGVMTAIKIR